MEYHYLRCPSEGDPVNAVKAKLENIIASVKAGSTPRPPSGEEYKFVK
jgi:hypothetical protein